MKKEFQSIQILHIALLIGSMFFFLITLFLGDFKLIQNVDDNTSPLLYLVIAFVPLCIIMSTFMNNKFLQAYDGGDKLIKKIENYRSRVIIRSALIEGSILFAAVVVLLESHAYAALIFIIGWFVLLYRRPSIDEFAKDYNLTSQEQRDMMKA